MINSVTVLAAIILITIVIFCWLITRIDRLGKESKNIRNMVNDIETSMIRQIGVQCSSSEQKNRDILGLSKKVDALMEINGLLL